MEKIFEKALKDIKVIVKTLCTRTPLTGRSFSAQLRANILEMVSNCRKQSWGCIPWLDFQIVPFFVFLDKFFCSGVYSWSKNWMMKLKDQNFLKEQISERATVCIPPVCSLSNKKIITSSRNAALRLLVVKSYATKWFWKNATYFSPRYPFEKIFQKYDISSVLEKIFSPACTL